MKNTEDVYPVLPMQELMLLHLVTASGSGALFEQECYLMEGELDVAACERAWQDVVGRHPILRTSFHVEGLKKPLQVVHKEVRLPWEKHDLRDLPAEDREPRIREFLQADRDRGFSPSRAPLMRMALLRTAADKHYLVRSFHHVLLDRWSWQLISGEAATLYEAYAAGRDAKLPPARPYRDYVRWFQQQDLALAETYWRRVLGGVESSRTFSGGTAGATVDPSAEQESDLRQLDADTTEALRALARKHRVTLNTIVRGAWALLTGRYGDRDDVVFGATVSGRPAELPGVESIAGLFINNLPVRVRITPEQPVGEWLAALHEQQLELQKYEHAPLPLVQECSGVSGGAPLFDSLVVFQNDPSGGSPATEGASGGTNGRGLVVRTVNSGMHTNYPVTLTVLPGARLAHLLTCERGRFDPGTIARIQEHFGSLLKGLCSNPARPVRTLQESLASVPELARSAAAPAAPPAVVPAVTTDADHAAPRTDAEITLAEVWQEVLGIDRVGVHDNFFDVGGSSVLLGQAILRLEEKTDIQLNPFDFGVHTLGQIAAICERRLEQARATASAAGSKRGLSSLLSRLVRRNK